VSTLHPMNKCSNTINYDWLEFTLTGDLKLTNLNDEYFEFPGGFILKELGYGTKHYSRMFEIYHEGLLFGNIRVDPRNNNVLDPLWQQFKVENERLYEKGTIDLCKRFFNSIGSQVRNVTRLDIACDGYGYMRLMKQYDSGMIEKIGKAKYTLYKNTSREIEGFDLGSKNSDKSITGYKKSAEIERSGKKYIELFWQRSGLHNWDGGNVERLEIRLKNNAIKKIENFDWTRLEEPEYIAGVMKTSMAKFFDFRHPVYSNISRARKIQFINWDRINAIHLDPATARKSNEYNRLKQTAKSLFWLYLGTGERYHLQICREIVENINCVGWFIEKQEFWTKEFRKKNKKLNFDYIPLWKQLGVNEQLKLTESVNLSFQYAQKKSKKR